MTHELAEKLKDASFPQRFETGEPPIQILSDGTARSLPYFPSLSELIEACEPRFKSLHHNIGQDMVGIQNEGWKKAWEWKATGMFSTPWHYAPGQIGEQISENPCFGNTAEEAVANLWLELHKK